MKEEILDIVDADENVVGVIARKHAGRLAKDKRGYVRVADLFLVNGAGQVWVPVRTADKAIAPNGYDFSASGHVESGDTVLQTLIRETQEEINLDITEDDIEYVAKGIYDDLGYMQHLYCVRTETTPDYNRTDFVSAEWWTPTELVERIDAGHPAKSKLRTSVLLLANYLARYF